VRPVAIDDVRSATTRLLLRTGALSDNDVRRPSRLPGWTVGHVLAHIALNAEAFVRVALKRREGRPGYMYPGGSSERDTDIADLAGHRAIDLVARLRSACHAFDARWTDLPPDGPCATAPGHPTFAVVSVLLRRLRELEVHSFDAAWSPLKNGPICSPRPT
jgi:maleylpyruvate isomerase